MLFSSLNVSMIRTSRCDVNTRLGRLNDRPSQIYYAVYLALCTIYLSHNNNQYYRESLEITNKMQFCNRIYYSKIYWRLNMFRAAYRSSSGAPNCFYSLWFIYPRGDRPLSRLGGNPPSLDNGRSPHRCINQRLQIQFGVPDDEWCAARNMLNLQ